MTEPQTPDLTNGRPVSYGRASREAHLDHVHLADDEPVECSDEPKLTAEEWAYIEAMRAEGDD